MCRLCKSTICDQRHLLSCKVLKSEVPELKKSNVKYHHIYGNIENIIPAIKLFSKISERREELLEILDASKSNETL